MPKLLLADDSVTVQRVIEMTFAGEDISVTAVSDGEQALARIAEERPDIVLASIAMPKRNGYDVSAFVKSHEHLASIPVLLMAGAFEPVDQERAEQVKCDGVLVKPLDPQQVIARVRELIGGARGTAAPATSGVPRPVERLTAPLKLVEPRRQGAPASPPSPPVASATPAARTVSVPPPDVPSKAVVAPPVRSAPPAPKAQAPSAFDAEETVAEGLDDALDDYFDRLDAAFASLDGAPDKESTASSAPREPRASRHGARQVPELEPQPQPEDDTEPVPTIDSLLGLREAPKRMDAPAPPVAVTPPPGAPAVPVAETPPLIQTASPTPIVPPAPPAAPVALMPPPVAAPVVEPPETSMTFTPSPAASAAEPPATKGSIADAFSALLAAELGEAPAVPIQLRGVPAEAKVTDELVEAVTRRVIERLAPDAARAVVIEVVSELAERLIREEIARIKEKR